MNIDCSTVCLSVWTRWKAKVATVCSAKVDTPWGNSVWFLRSVLKFEKTIVIYSYKMSIIRTLTVQLSEIMYREKLNWIESWNSWYQNIYGLIWCALAHKELHVTLVQSPTARLLHHRFGDSTLHLIFSDVCMKGGAARSPRPTWCTDWRMCADRGDIWWCSISMIYRLDQYRLQESHAMFAINNHVMQLTPPPPALAHIFHRPQSAHLQNHHPGHHCNITRGHGIKNISQNKSFEIKYRL